MGIKFYSRYRSLNHIRHFDRLRDSGRWNLFCLTGHFMNWVKSNQRNNSHLIGRMICEDLICTVDFQSGLSTRKKMSHYFVNILLMNKFLTEKNITMIPQPFYSPDLSPYGCFPFLKVERQRGHHFGIVENMQQVMANQGSINWRLSTLSTLELKPGLCHLVTSEGNYFEVDEVDQ